MAHFSKLFLFSKQLLTQLHQNCPPLVTQLLGTLCPYKSLAIYRQYFFTSQGILDGTNRKAQHQLKVLFALLLYFIALNAFQLFLPQPTLLRYIFFDSALCLFGDRTDSRFFNLFYLIQAPMTLTYYYFFYQKDNSYINQRMERLIIRPETDKNTISNYVRILWRMAHGERQKAQVLLPSLAWGLLNFLQVFILSLDLVAIALFIKAEALLDQEYSDFFFTSLIGLCSYLLHLAHFFLFVFYWYAYAHVLIFAGTYGQTILGYLFLRVQENKRLLQSSAIKPGSFFLDRFLVESVSIHRFLFAFDATHGTLFFVYLLANVPFCAFLSVQLYLGNLQGVGRLVVLVLVGENVLVTFFFHLVAVQFSARLKENGRTFLYLVGRFNREISGNRRRKLSLSLHLARLHSTRPYGVTYAGMAVINLAAFRNCAFLFCKCILYSHKILQHSP